MGENRLTITAWNMRSLGCAETYIHELMTFSDILVLSEHRLYENELHRLEMLSNKFEFQSKSSKDLEAAKQTRQSGHCGISICWRAEINHKIKVIEIRSDRLCIIEIVKAIEQQSLFVIGVYLPQQGCKITSFDHHLNILSELIAACQEKGEVLIIGDTNCHFGKDIHSRFGGQSTQNAKKMMQSITSCNMQIIDGQRICSGPNYTFHVDGVGTS